MFSRIRLGVALVLGLSLAVQGGPVNFVCAQSVETQKNMFGNASFEAGRSSWWMDAGPGTAAHFAVDTQDAGAGRYSALVSIEAVGEWGVQFGQVMEAGRRGKTYTFAVLAKSTGQPVAVELQVQRAAEPWDNAVSKSFILKADEWTELHVTFKVAAEFPEGWSACVYCAQPGAQFRADMFRLYEGDYIPYAEVAFEEVVSAAVRLFDTGASSAPLSGDPLSRRDGWTELAEDQVGRTLAGDAVIFNNRLALVLRRGERGAELYSVGPKGLKMRALLAPVGGETAGLSSVEVLESNAGVVAVDATFETAGGQDLTVGYELRMGQVFVETEPRGGVGALRIEAPCRFAVLPDFFADDIVVDATELPVSEAELPGENFLLQMLEGRDAIVMSVWDSREQDIRVTLAGGDGGRVIEASEIPYGESGKVWVGVMEGAGVWHSRDVAGQDAGKIIELDWRAPYAAQWRVDWRRSDRLTDSWEMIAERAGGRFTKHGWFGGPGSVPADRRKWTTVLGWFRYPCWLDRDGRGYLQPLRRVLRFEGPALIYPINRVAATPLEAYTVVDIVRSTLGVGPCEYILDVEGQAQQYRGMATCGVRDTLNAIYGSGQQRHERDEIERTLVAVMAFIRHIRGRIEAYVTFGHQMLDYLEEQKNAHPELAAHLAELEVLVRAIDQCVARRKEEIKTPDYAAELVERFRATMLDYEGADALAKCKEFTEAWVEIGGNQDELVGECRWAVKVLRQRAGLAPALEPGMAEVAREVRRRTQEVLRNPAGHEGARH